MSLSLNIRLLLIYVLALGFLSLNPWLRPDPHQAFGLVTWDLVDHASAYGLLTILFLSVLKWSAQQYKVTLLAVLVSSMIGVMLEFGQLWLTSTRAFSFFDAYANIFGSVIGAIVFWSIRLGIRIKNKPKVCS
jgi:VanZ family protein